MGDVTCRKSIDILRKYDPEKVSKGSAAVVAKWCKERKYITSVVYGQYYM